MGDFSGFENVFESGKSLTASEIGVSAENASAAQRPIILATRGSALALVQAKEVQALLEKELEKRKIDRALEWSRRRRLIADGRDPDQEEMDAEVRSHGKGKGKLPSVEELRAEQLEELQNTPLEKGDFLSMVIAGFITIFPVCVGLILLICLVVYLFFS